MADCELAIVGAGNMAEAIVRGVLGAGLLAPQQIVAADPDAKRRELFGQMGVEAVESATAAVRPASRILLAVKPQTMSAVLAELAGVARPDALIVSIAAGVSTWRIESALPGQSRRVVRVMPNTPMLVGRGMSVLVKGSHATDEDLHWARRLFDAGGETLVVDDEALIDAVTAVSGSGPAYFFYLIENMVAAGQAEGLSEADAVKLAAVTCQGAAMLLLESGQPPRELRRKVTSPGGTTQAACDLLDARGVKEAMIDAVRAAAARSRELGG
ncbi:MAG: Pyrroline-5-carboxylate reductase [Phycisphaerae bacterium]|nr:Pyrroline-5-carboxylate reductase [Phycisphaerae bacterium]